MAYFKFTEVSCCYDDKWQDLVDYIKNEWPSDVAAHLGDLTHHIEAKALYVFTVSRHLIEKAEILAEKSGGWEPIFVEATILLFPMIELIGEVRLGKESGNRLGSGIDWLINPLIPPRPNRTKDDLKADNDRVGNLGNYMKTLSDGPRVRELFHLRNYFIHGLKDQSDRDFDIGAVRTSMNYELPCAIVEQSKVGLVIYWDQLKNDKSWVIRLAEAKIYPFGIMGSQIYEKGLIDPEIVYWLTPS